MASENPLTPPSQPGEWSLKQIEETFSRPLPESMLGTIKEKGNAPYIPWYRVVTILNKYCPGWCWEIVKLEMSADRIFLIGRLSIPTSNGLIYREATGTEQLKRIVIDPKTKKEKIVELAYDDPSSNAESMAFRRAAAKFNLGLYLYEKERPNPQSNRQYSQSSTGQMTSRSPTQSNQQYPQSSAGKMAHHSPTQSNPQYNSPSLGKVTPPLPPVPPVPPQIPQNMNHDN
jgi:hypothetical protein